MTPNKQCGAHAAPLYNKNWQTAIGLGDESASNGQLKSADENVPGLANAALGGGSRNVKVVLAIGDPPVRRQNSVRPEIIDLPTLQP